MAYTDDDLDALDALLQALPQEDMPMTLSELDGYVTGVLVAPGLIPPSEWLAGVWGESGSGGFPDLATAEATIQAIMAHYNDVAAFINADGWIEPIYEEDLNSGDTLWEPWVDGFVRAVRLREAEWLGILKGSDDDAASALAMMLTMHEVYVGTSDLPEEAVDEIDREAPDLIPNLVHAILGATRQGPMSFSASPLGPERSPPFRAQRLPGRNDPCPCGSGRKYKQCCGRN